MPRHAFFAGLNNDFEEIRLIHASNLTTRYPTAGSVMIYSGWAAIFFFNLSRKMCNLDPQIIGLSNDAFGPQTSVSSCRWVSTFPAWTTSEAPQRVFCRCESHLLAILANDPRRQSPLSIFPDVDAPIQPIVAGCGAKSCGGWASSSLLPNGFGDKIIGAGIQCGDLVTFAVAHA